MPYGYDKTRTERRCKDCNKLLYVFEVGEFCIECSRKKGKTVGEFCIECSRKKGKT